ncbi:hypothetical protein C0033_00780 [Clostridium sp. chh4-2]|uniref:hypothetical protein n=1 Tax=Clostridium sp. chh4-2 TaxID=2067550 RepID=UPI000CCE8289|nr:hypothetical protein [Clostridium sp. chh4-2]PNV63899.1 hypothetical protein C0033_00780 [Clostridium sp. chh4-2]
MELKKDNYPLLRNYRLVYQQAFIPIFVKDDFDTETLLAGVRLAGVRAMEYTLRREDAHRVLPGLKKKFPECAVLAGSTIDAPNIVRAMKPRFPQLMTLEELAPFVDGFVSMLPFCDGTIRGYRDTHLMIPSAESSGEALRQMRSGATFIKHSGPGTDFTRKLHAAPTFNYCPTFITGGISPDRMEEVYVAGDVLTAAGFDLILKGVDPDVLTPELVAQKLEVFLDTAKAARLLAHPELEGIEQMSDGEFLRVLPNVCSITSVQ